MTTRRWAGRGRPRTAAAVLAVASAVAGCDSLLTQPAPASREIAVSFAFEGDASGGVTEAFDRVNRVLLRFTRPDGAQRDTTVRLTNQDGVARARLILDTRERVAALGVYAELLANNTALFSGSRVIRVENGTATSAEIELSPIPFAVRADRAGLLFQNVGDTTRLASAVLFASGDTIPGLAGAWSSEDPDIVFITPAGLAAARHVGETRLVVRYATLTDTITARVLSDRALRRAGYAAAWIY